jgi:uncharacterized protein YyaL (SSP411 family)/aryl-alcohol dehydrogenase-like predicted oxidoreductase
VKHTNRLAESTSPYLLQHAHNPVDWYPWGEEALTRARAEDKPILLSIGYSACHWCHVMERESFENEDVAALMNASFICIKVDREERPDLDDIYMAATLAMNQGHGGWPMTVFLTPEQEPFFAGTYFPPEDRWGRPGFRTLLDRIAVAWRDDRANVRAQGAELVQYLRQNTRSAPGGALGEDELRAAADQLARDFDARAGGFGAAPKFPPSAALSLLLRCHRRSGDAHALEMVTRTLDAMAEGGMYDQVGGGFHRYSVDAEWLVPHFEKMLYDNALLAGVYLEGFQATGNAFYARVAREILDYVLREMTGPEGGFHSATDADSEGEEGRFFVWTPDEVEAALGDAETARRVCAYYDISERGNWEGKSIPNTSRTGKRVAAALGIGEDELERTVAEARPRLYAARRQRVAPGLDDKVLTAWNGLMIASMAEGARVLGEPRFQDAAERAASFLLATLRKPDGRLLRTARAGKAHLDAYLEDYAYLADGLVTLYEAGADVRFLRAAEQLCERMRADFAAPDGGFFSTARDHESLIVRHREGHDGATPSANAMAALALARLSYHLDREDLRADAVRAVQSYARVVARQPRSFATTLRAVDLMLEGPLELAFVGDSAGLQPLRAAVAAHFLPNRIVAHAAPGEDPGLPLLAGKTLVDGRAALYVCRDFACRRPVTDPADVAAALASSPAPPETPRSIADAPLAGRATTSGTADFAARRPEAVHGYARLGATGLTCSRIGFGGYRIDDESDEHRAALVHAIRSGCNLVDTSTNYAGGASERLVGQVLRELVRAGDVTRGEITVVSKIGYAQGENLERAQEREKAGAPFPEMVKYSDDVWHCIHPEFLEEQLARSLARLQLATLDVCLLHNPEYFLSDGHERSHGRLDGRREEFRQRLERAFAYLETQVAAGRIGAYGVSSNTVARPAADPEATSLAVMLDAARKAGGTAHHFHVLQLPLNILEGEGALERSTGGAPAHSVLEYAAEHDIGILVNRPLNALRDGAIVRLADVDTSGPEAPLEELTAAVAALEDEYRRDIALHLLPAQGGVPPDQFFRWAQEMQGVIHHVRSVEHWQAIESQRILPRAMQVLQVLDEGLTGEVAETWQSWRRRYLPRFQELLAGMRRAAALKSVAEIARVREQVMPLLPEAQRHESLARLAVWVLGSTPGVSSVLVGMRRPEYVDDVMAVLAWPKLDTAVRVLETVNGSAPR